MKRVLLIVFLSFSIFVSLSAQSDTSFFQTPEVSLSGGVSLPYLPTEFKNYWKTGSNIGIGYGYSFTPGSLGYGTLYATVEYSRFTFDDSSLINKLNLRGKILAINSNPFTEIFTIMANFKGSFSPTKRTAAPYFLIGVGYFKLTARNVDVTGDTTFTISGDSKASFAWSFGVGIEIPFTESLGIFFQGKSVLGVIEPTRQDFPISGGIQMRF